MFLAKLAVCVCMVFYEGVRGDSIISGGTPNLTGLVPTVSISRKTVLESADINLKLEVYQRPITATTSTAIKVVSGSTNINSTNRCIAWSFSFDLWGELPIENQQTTENGGCDALWGSECSRAILNRLRQSLGNISGTACGVHTSNLISNPPPECSRRNTTRVSFYQGTLLSNNFSSFQPFTPTDPPKPWISFTSDPGNGGDYEKLMKNNVFAYFVNRDYNLNDASSAIACLTVYNKTDTITTPKPTSDAPPTMLPGRLLFMVSMIATVARSLF